MRIISGKYKGHQLVSFNADHIRPTTDRVKESLFNMIQMHIDGARVLDLFSGTGNLGLEALSRGAESVQFVEKNRKSIQILEQNIKKLKVDEPHQILQKDVLTYLKNYDGPAFDLIFADPPFTEQMAHDVMLMADVSKVFHSETLMMIESARREKILEDYPTLTRYDVREFGDKVLSFFKKKSE
jgi:16S rRNA (guanine966-N2)-methyltransferase